MRERLPAWLCTLLVIPRHWFAWIVALLLSLVSILILIPGECVYQSGLPSRVGPTLLPDQMPRELKNGEYSAPPPDAPRMVYEYAHGWPWPYLLRAKGYVGKGWPKRGDEVMPKLFYPKTDTRGREPVSWSAPIAWPFSSDRSEWSIGCLLLDLVCVLGLISTVTLLTEHWIRRRKGLFRLRLIDILGATTAMALCLGWWQWHLGQQEIERKAYLAKLTPSSMSFEVWLNSPSQEELTDYTPVWLRRILGNSVLTQWCRHLSEPIGKSMSAEHLRRGWEYYSQLHYLRHAALHAEPSKEVLEQLANLQQLRSLEIRLRSNDSNFDEVLIDLSPLAKLSQLERLEIMCPYLLVEDLSPLLQCPSLREVQLEKASIMQSEIEAFQQTHHPPFALTHQGNVQPWGVAYVQLARWMAEDRINYSQLAKLQVGTINLTDLQVTTERLQRLSIVADEIAHLKFGEVGQVEGLWQFVTSCPNLQTLDLGSYPVEDQQLAMLVKSPRLQSLAMTQANATPEMLKSLADLTDLKQIQIFAATWPVDLLREVEQAFNPPSQAPTVVFDAYRDSAGEQRIETGLPSPAGPFD